MRVGSAGQGSCWFLWAQKFAYKTALPHTNKELMEPWSLPAGFAIVTNLTQGWQGQQFRGRWPCFWRGQINYPSNADKDTQPPSSTQLPAAAPHVTMAHWGRGADPRWGESSPCIAELHFAF